MDQPITTREGLLEFLLGNGYTSPSQKDLDEALWWASRGYRALGKTPSPSRPMPDVYWLDPGNEKCVVGGYVYTFDIIFVCGPKKAHMETLVHELTHWLQGTSESTVGVAAEDPLAYANMATEVEARLVQNMYYIGTLDPMDQEVQARHQRMTQATIDGVQNFAKEITGA